MKSCCDVTNTKNKLKQLAFKRCIHRSLRSGFVYLVSDTKPQNKHVLIAKVEQVKSEQREAFNFSSTEEASWIRSEISTRWKQVQLLQLNLIYCNMTWSIRTFTVLRNYSKPLGLNPVWSWFHSSHRFVMKSFFFSGIFRCQQLPKWSKLKSISESQSPHEGAVCQENTSFLERRLDSHLQCLI